MTPLIAMAIAEDLGSGDVTVAALGGGSQLARATLVAREPVVVCGLAEAASVFAAFSPAVEFSALAAEGDFVAGPLARVAGPAGALLGAERTALNFMMRMCAVATATRKAVDAVPKDCVAQIYDTRKTVPGWRELDKRAVRVGGGHNHRRGLHDAVMLKDNHWALFGADRVRAAARAAGVPVVVEVDTLAQLSEVLGWNAAVILLDNFSLADLAEAVRLCHGRVPLEASGRVTLARIPEIARTGVDRISMGALTHSVVAPDLSLELHT